MRYLNRPTEPKKKKQFTITRITLPAVVFLHASTKGTLNNELIFSVCAKGAAGGDGEDEILNTLYLLSLTLSRSHCII